MQALLLVVEHGGPPRCARIGIIRALNRGYVRELNTSRKDHGINDGSPQSSHCVKQGVAL